MHIPVKDTEPQVWLVTGTSSGLGQRLVQSIITRNDKVIATARDISKIQDFRKLADETQLYILQLDVTDSIETIQSRIREAISVWGRIDVLVNNAGSSGRMLLEEGGVMGIKKVFDVNVYGVMNVTNAVLPYMRDRRSGTVVITGSRVAYRNELFGAGAYSASKAAVHALGETLSAEVKPFSIQIMILQPGSFRTGMHAHPTVINYPISEYDEIRGKMEERFASIPGHEVGNPVKGMETLVDVVKHQGQADGKPLPLRLALGSDAAVAISEKTQQLNVMLDEWKDIIESSDFDPPHN